MGRPGKDDFMSKSKLDSLNTIHCALLVTANSTSVYREIKANITKVFQEICKEEGRQAIIEMRHFLPAYGGAQTKHSDTIEIFGSSWYSRENDAHKNPPPDMLKFEDLDFSKPVSAAKGPRAGKYDRMKAAVEELDDASKECGLYDSELHGLLYALRKMLDLLEDKP